MDQRERMAVAMIKVAMPLWCDAEQRWALLPQYLRDEWCRLAQATVDLLHEWEIDPASADQRAAVRSSAYEPKRI